jgi:hypothetical protein
MKPEKGWQHDKLVESSPSPWGGDFRLRFGLRDLV